MDLNEARPSVVTCDPWDILALWLDGPAPAESEAVVLVNRCSLLLLTGFLTFGPSPIFIVSLEGEDPPPTTVFFLPPTFCLMCASYTHC